MSPARFGEVTSRYASLRMVLLGDFCLDRYLEIDPDRSEISIETGLQVHNVVRVRSQPGGAGTILNNLAALGVGHTEVIGFCGDDGEGYELQRALRRFPGVGTEDFMQTAERRTFTYCKPLILHSEKAPEELNRLDSKNWDPTPAVMEDRLILATQTHASRTNAIVVLDQVDIPDTGVVTRRVRDSLGALAVEYPELLILADSRRGLRDWPAVGFKMNAVELAALLGEPPPAAIDAIATQAAELARRQQRPVIVTLAERGVVGALADGVVEHVTCLPLHGPIDIVGAGDAVMANLAASLAAGATLRESLELAMAAASVVIHQLGTTGTASVPQLRELLVS